MSNLLFLTTNQIEQAETTFMNGATAVTVTNLDCATGSPLITRASGSFITDGVRLKAVLSGTIAARFAANTRVNSITEMSLGMSANAGSDGPGTESGTFTPIAGLQQDTTAPMSNVQIPDRYVFWDSGAGSYSTAYLCYDIGYSKACSSAGVLRHVPADYVVGGISSVGVYSAATITGATPAWTMRWTLTPTDAWDRDFGVSRQTPASGRYWMFAVSFSGRCSVGGLWLGASANDVDLAREGGPGSTVEITANTATVINPYTGAPQVTRFGGERIRRTLDWGALTTAQRTQLRDSVFRNRGVDTVRFRAPVLIDEDGDWNEVRFSEDRFAWSRVFTGVDSMLLDVEGLP